MEVRLSHGIRRRAFQRPTHETFWCGKVYSGGNLPLGFQIPILLHLAMEKIQSCPKQGRNKSSVQSLCFILKLSSLDPSSCQTCMAVWSPARNNAQMRGASARLQARESARMHGVSVASWVGEYERASLFHWDYINVGLEWTRCFIKITNQLPKIL